MARALLGYVATADQLREMENARLRSRVRELQDRVDLLETEVHSLRADAALSEETRRVLASHELDSQLDELARDHLAASSV